MVQAVPRYAEQSQEEFQLAEAVRGPSKCHIVRTKVTDKTTLLSLSPDLGTHTYTVHVSRHFNLHRVAFDLDLPS